MAKTVGNLALALAASGRDRRDSAPGCVGFGSLCRVGMGHDTTAPLRDQDRDFNWSFSLVPDRLGRDVSRDPSHDTSDTAGLACA
jgi:hypothetical protein